MTAALATLLGAALLAQPARAAPPPSPAPATIRPATFGEEGAVELDPVEEQAARAAGGDSARLSPALVRAARSLAAAAAAGARDPLSGARLRRALASAAAFDPAPAAHLAFGPDRTVVDALGARAAAAQPTHVGAGVARAGGATYLVLLASERKVLLQPFPQRVSPGTDAVLRGELLGLGRARVALTRPSGEPLDVASQGDVTFSARVHFTERGRHLLEVLGAGARGPEVVALLSVDVGEPPPEPQDAPGPEHLEPADLAAAEAQVEAAVNALRGARGLAALPSDAALRGVARRHSADMLASGVVAHVLPGSGDVAARLRRSGVPYDRVLENVARGPSALAAHEATAESPAHRGAILDPGVHAMACGIARGRLASGEPVVYLTQLFVERVDPASARTSGNAVRAALERERLRRTQRPIRRDAALDRLATRAAEEMAAAGAVAPEPLGQRALRMSDRKLAGAEAFVGSGADEVARAARGLDDARFRRFGVGVAIGDNPRFGAGRLWVAVVFTD